MIRLRLGWASILVVTAVGFGCSSDADADNQIERDASATDAGEKNDAATQHAKLQLQLSASGSHACALRKAGLYCWGDNFFGQLGNESLDDSEAAVEAVAAGSDIVEVVTNTGRTCVRRKSGEVGCWGANEWGQIGDGTRTNALHAVPVQGIDDAIGLAVDVRATCVLRKNRSVACWGESPEATPDAGSLLPMPIAGWSDIEEVRTGANSVFCARGRTGSVSCIAFDGTSGKWTEPREVQGLTGARAITVASPDLTCAISKAGKIVCENKLDGTTLEMPDSEDTVGIDSLGTLDLVGVNGKGEWKLWNVPSFFWIAMGMQNVAGGQAYPLRSDVALTETRCAGFQICALRDDRSVACLNGNDSISQDTTESWRCQSRSRVCRTSRVGASVALGVALAQVLTDRTRAQLISDGAELRNPEVELPRRTRRASEWSEDGRDCDVRQRELVLQQKRRAPCEPLLDVIGGSANLVG